MAKKNISGGDVLLGLAIFAGKVIEEACDTPQTVFIPRGTNIGFSNLVEARKYAEKYISGGSSVITNVAPVYVVEENTTKDIFNQTTVTRRYSDGSIETIKTDIFGQKRTSRTGGSGSFVRVQIPTIVPIDRVTRKPSQLQGGKVYNSLIEWERGW
jgi:hypothetical protein